MKMKHKTSKPNPKTTATRKKQKKENTKISKIVSLFKGAISGLKQFLAI